MCLRLDQSVQEPSALSSQSCQASDCHCIKMFHRLDQICELQWQSGERQIWLPMAGDSCTGWSNLRYIGRIYDFCRYISKKSSATDLPFQDLILKGPLFTSPECLDKIYVFSHSEIFCTNSSSIMIIMLKDTHKICNLHRSEINL